MARRAAVIDLGSLAVRLHIAEAPPEGPGGGGGPGAAPFRSLFEDRRIARLAEGLEPGGDLPQEGEERVLDILRGFRAAIGRFGVDPRWGRIAATEVLRKARNGPAFAERIGAETGLSVIILAPEEEARWTARGALLSGSALPRPVLIADPGGGSLEVVWAGETEGDEEALPLRAGSEPLGILDLLRRFPLGAPADPVRLADLESEVERGVRRAVGRVRPPGGRAASLLVTGGTALNLAAMSRETLPGRVPALGGTTVSRETLDALYHRLAAADLDARREEPCLERGREDVIVPGLAVLRGLLAETGAGSLIVTPFGLREGLLDALLRGRGLPGEVP